MIKPKFSVLSFCFAFFALSFRLTFAQPVSSTELIQNANSYDGKTVIYEGEIVGDIMRRGDFVCVNVYDGQKAIGVWMKSALADQIVYAGSYRSIGDGIEITGVFNRACPEHGGDLDIHAQAVRKTASGRLLTRSLNLRKKNFALILLGLLCLIWISTLLKRK